MKLHFDINIYGLVQGVSFRYYSRVKAQELGISGLARNEPDGSLYIEAEGEKEALEKFLNWCRQGPPAAYVEKVKTAVGPLRGYENFSVG